MQISIFVFYYFLYTAFMEPPATPAKYPVCSITIKHVIFPRLKAHAAYIRINCFTISGLTYSLSLLHMCWLFSNSILSSCDFSSASTTVTCTTSFSCSRFLCFPFCDDISAFSCCFLAFSSAFLALSSLFFLAVSSLILFFSALSCFFLSLQMVSFFVLFLF